MKLTEIFKKKKSVPRANPVTETDVKSPSASATGQQQTTAQTFLNKHPLFPAPVLMKKIWIF